MFRKRIGETVFGFGILIRLSERLCALEIWMEHCRLTMCEVRYRCHREVKADIPDKNSIRELCSSWLSRTPGVPNEINSLSEGSLMQMIMRIAVLLLILWPTLVLGGGKNRARSDKTALGTFTIEQALSAPFPTDLVAAPANGLFAWVYDSEGKRNIWVAELTHVAPMPTLAASSRNISTTTVRASGSLRGLPTQNP